MTMFLTQEEIIQLTKRKVCSAQAKALKTMGIVHKVRPDGSVAVMTSHVEKLLDGGEATVKNARNTEPNWNAMNAASP